MIEGRADASLLSMTSRLILGLLTFTLLVSSAAARTIATAQIGHGLTLNYYVSAPPGAPARHILIVMHGYTRDANRTFDAAARQVGSTAHPTDTLIVAPLFQVPATASVKCSFPGIPAPTATNALWHCGDWSAGKFALNGTITSFQAIDRLIGDLIQIYPGARSVTIAGFSAGGQFVQHYIGFARPPSASISLRYVVSDPSAFLYFDPSRPMPGRGTCPSYNDWKFGTDHMPTDLGRRAGAARAFYAKADVTYLEGSLDSGEARGAAYKFLEKNCSAEVQGPYRLQRGIFYAAYDKARLAHGTHRLIIVPGCAHKVTCVFEAPAARAALLGG